MKLMRHKNGKAENIPGNMRDIWDTSNPTLLQGQWRRRNLTGFIYQDEMFFFPSTKEVPEIKDYYMYQKSPHE